MLVPEFLGVFGMNKAVQTLSSDIILIVASEVPHPAGKEDRSSTWSTDASHDRKNSKNKGFPQRMVQRTVSLRGACIRTLIEKIYNHVHHTRDCRFILVLLASFVAIFEITGRKKQLK